jgi:D-amino peptidase
MEIKTPAGRVASVRASLVAATAAAGAAAIAVVIGLATTPLAAQSDGLSIYISADMEGITGVVTGEQLGPGGFEYGRFREFMTLEVIAAIDAARASGATRILVSDSHGNGQNLLIERFAPDVEVIRSWPRPLGMMEGIDETFDAAFYIGYHASTTNTAGVRAHTMSSANLTSVRLNGIQMTEGGLNAATAGHFGVPVVMISGDDAVVDEVRGLLGDIEGAVVKEAISFHAARTLTPEAGRLRISEAVTRAMGRLGDFHPYTLTGPYTLELSFKSYTAAELLAYLPNVERVDSHTISFTGQDMTVVSRFIQMALNYSAGITP